MISFLHIGQLISFAVLLATGQILFKKTALGIAVPVATPEGILALLLNGWFWLAMIFYSIATLLWIHILQNLPLSIAYPFNALGFIIVPLVSWLLFKEPITVQFTLGVFLILAGLSVIATSMGR